jgi:hypothetical protein
MGQGEDLWLFSTAERKRSELSMASNRFVRLRTTAGQSVLLTSSWGFGLLLVIGLFMVSVANRLVETTILGDSPETIRHLGLPQWLWSVSAAAAAYFAAAAIAYPFAQAQRCGVLHSALLLAASTFALIFPLMGLAFTVLLIVEGLRGSLPVIIEDFLGLWWGAFRAYGLFTLLWLSLCSIAVAYLVPISSPSEERSSTALYRQRRVALWVGVVSISSGILIAGHVWWTAITYLQNNPLPVLSDADLAHIWSEVRIAMLTRALPYFGVGGLLLLPPSKN